MIFNWVHRLKLRRRMNHHAMRHEWTEALALARQLGDTESRYLFALARAVQIMSEDG